MELLLCVILLVLFAVLIAMTYFSDKLFKSIRSKSQSITLDMVDTNRELPRNKSIYYNAALMELNDFGFEKDNLFSAIILNWIKEENIVAGENNELSLTPPKQYENEYEEQLFLKLQEASRDNILQEKELKKWMKVNLDSIYYILMVLVNDEIKKMVMDGQVKEVDNEYIMNDQVYNDSVQLLGLKKYLMHYSEMEEKETDEVHLWEDYLIYASLFGIADKIEGKMGRHYKNMKKDTVLDTFFIVLGEFFMSNDYTNFNKENF